MWAGSGETLVDEVLFEVPFGDKATKLEMRVTFVTLDERWAKARTKLGLTRRPACKKTSVATTVIELPNLDATSAFQRNTKEQIQVPEETIHA